MTRLRPRGPRVGVLGGGLSGLACAHYLLKAGAEVVVLEGAVHPRDRAVSGSLPVLESLEEPLRGGDSATCGLLSDLGLLGQVSWRPVTSALSLDGVLHGAGGLGELVASLAPGNPARLRARLATSFVRRVRFYAIDLDHVPAGRWLRRLYGAELGSRVFEPWLEARFGAAAHDIPAYCVWQELHRAMPHEVLGRYTNGGQGLIPSLVISLEKRGASVRFGERVAALFLDEGRPVVALDRCAERFDAVVSTLPLEEMRATFNGPLRDHLPERSAERLDRIDVLALTRVPPGGAYATTVLDPGLDFREIVEPTQLAPLAGAGKRYAVRLRHRCAPGAGLAGLSDDVVAKRALDTLRNSMPFLGVADVELVGVARTLRAEPRWRAGAVERLARTRLGAAPVYLCGPDGLYPRGFGADARISLAREIAQRLASETETGKDGDGLQFLSSS